MCFCAAVGAPKKSGVARLFTVFATAVLANFQDRLVMTASITLRVKAFRKKGSAPTGDTAMTLPHHYITSPAENQAS